MLLHRSTYYYPSRKKDDRALRMRIKELAYSRPRYGYRRLTVLLQREGWEVNHKRIYRIYGEEELLVRTKRRKKRAAQRRLKPLPATRVGEHWSIDFVSDQLADGRRFRVLTAIDQVSRECVCLEVAQKLPADAVTAALNQAIWAYGQPKVITSAQSHHLRQRDRVHQQSLRPVGVQARDRTRFHRSGPTGGERVHRELQRQAP